MTVAFLSTDFLNANNLEKNIPVLLVSAGAMLGGILAIIFSFGNLLMQNAATGSSAGFYNIVGRDHVQHVIYCFGLSVALEVPGTRIDLICAANNSVYVPGNNMR